MNTKDIISRLGDKENLLDPDFMGEVSKEIKRGNLSVIDEVWSGLKLPAYPLVSDLHGQIINQYLNLFMNTVILSGKLAEKILDPMRLRLRTLTLNKQDRINIFTTGRILDFSPPPFFTFEFFLERPCRIRLQPISPAIFHFSISNLPFPSRTSTFEETINLGSPSMWIFNCKEILRRVKQIAQNIKFELYPHFKK